MKNIIKLLLFYFFITTYGCSFVYAHNKAKNTNIPKPVVEFADNHLNYFNSSNIHLQQQKDWNNYKIYYILFDDCNCGFCGNPKYIVYHDKEIRFATSDEATNIYFANKKKYTGQTLTSSINEAMKLYCKNK